MTLHQELLFPERIFLRWSCSMRCRRNVDLSASWSIVTGIAAVLWALQPVAGMVGKSTE